MRIHDLFETMKPGKLFYHGTNAMFDAFDLDFIGKGHDQEGPGFYFSDKLDTAVMHGSRLLACRLTPRRLIHSTGLVNAAAIQDMILKSPVKDDVLMNFDEHPGRALRSAVAATIVSGDPKESFERVWYDFYRDHAKLWAEAMIRLGYDGTSVKQQDGSTHVVMFNPTRIEIVKVQRE